MQMQEPCTWHTQLKHCTMHYLAGGLADYAQQATVGLLNYHTIKNGFHLGHTEFRDLAGPVDWNQLQELGSLLIGNWQGSCSSHTARLVLSVGCDIKVLTGHCAGEVQSRSTLPLLQTCSCSVLLVISCSH